MCSLGGRSHVLRTGDGVEAFTGAAAVPQNDRLPTDDSSLLAFTSDLGDKGIRAFFWRMGRALGLNFSSSSPLQGLKTMARQVHRTAC